MDILKKYFPFAFAQKPDIVTLVIHVVIHLLAPSILGLLITLITKIIPFLGWPLGIIASLFGIYALVSLVLSVLDYLKVLK